MLTNVFKEIVPVRCPVRGESSWCVIFSGDCSTVVMLKLLCIGFEEDDYYFVELSQKESALLHTPVQISRNKKKCDVAKMTA